MSEIQVIPDSFDVSTVDDSSALPKVLLDALREGVWRKCVAQPIWFLQNFWSVMNMDTFEWEIFRLREYQIEDAEWFLEAMRGKRQRRDVLKARQIGWTTIAAGLAGHDIFFQKNHPWLITSQTEGDAQGTLTQRIKTPYNRLPQWMRERGPKLTSDNMEVMEFDNGSSVLSIPATSKAGRSKAVYGVLMDEAAFADAAEEMFGALDPLCYGPMFVFSTANGMGNFFHQTWVESMRSDSAWDGRFRPWNVVPDRDQEWYDTEYRKYRGKEWLFYQENPSTPEEAFAKTGRTVFNITNLQEDMDFCDPEYRFDLVLDPEFDRPEPVEGQDFDQSLHVWELPYVEKDKQGRVLQDPNYVIGIDIAEGLEHADRTSIDVYNANTGHQAASYLGYYPVEDLGELVARIGYFYHTALLLPERNNAGILPIVDLQRARYPRLWRMGALASIPRGDKTPRYGWNTNKATKPKAVNELIRETSNRTVVIHDSRFLVEANTFIHDGRGGMAAASGQHDDKVMSTIIAIQGVLGVGAYPVVWYSEDIQPVTMGDIANLGKPRGKSNPMEGNIGHEQREVEADRSFFI